MRTIHLTMVILSAAIIASVPATSLGQVNIPGSVPKTTQSQQLSIPGSVGGSGPLTRPGLVPNVAYAGTTLECGGKSYHVTTGTTSGNCSNIMAPDGITKVGVACKDTKGNYSNATCGSGCGSSTGAGDCTIK